jgi:ABC-type nitrate/sulfonate/bicarbonate transport system ATPase subunit/ABC-type nitrate/sulfonate/bicarbonate transport system permease component
VLLAAWAGVSLIAGTYFVPPPWTTVGDAALLLASGQSWAQILTTLLRVCVGFLAGYAAGIAAGIAAGSRRGIDALLRPLVLFFQGVPPLLWAIPIVALMGIGHLPTILVIALITFPLVAVTVGEGMSTLPRTLGEMLQLFAPGFAPKIRELVFPHLKPFLAAGLKAGLVLAVKASVTAEYFGANDGIGFQIQAAYMSMQIRRLFAWAVVLVLVILAFNHLLPRLRALGSLLGRLRGRDGAIACRPEDIRELKGIFTAKKSAPRIAVEGVSFSWPRGERVLQDVNLSVSSREIAVISGESGIGKSTLLRLVSSLARPTEGRVFCPSAIGFVFQDDRLLPWRNIAENTALPLLYQGYPRKNALCFAHYLLSEAGLSGQEEKRPDELSGGMKKRASLARCFARLPEAILLDEPFSGLHREARRHLWEMFLRLLSLHPVPVIIVTHFPEEVPRAAPGRMYELAGKPASLMKRLRRGAGSRA